MNVANTVFYAQFLTLSWVSILCELSLLVANMRYYYKSSIGVAHLALFNAISNVVGSPNSLTGLLRTIYAIALLILSVLSYCGVNLYSWASASSMRLSVSWCVCTFSWYTAKLFNTMGYSVDFSIVS